MKTGMLFYCQLYRVQQVIQACLTGIAVSTDSCGSVWMEGDKRMAGRLMVLAAVLLQHAAS